MLQPSARLCVVCDEFPVNWYPDQLVPKALILTPTLGYEIARYELTLVRLDRHPMMHYKCNKPITLQSICHGIVHLSVLNCCDVDTGQLRSADEQSVGSASAQWRTSAGRHGDAQQTQGRGLHRPRLNLTRGTAIRSLLNPLMHEVAKTVT